METFQSIITALTTQNELLTNILFIPFYFIEAYVSFLLFTTLFNIECSKGQRNSFIIALSILAIITRNIIPNPYGTIINALLYFALLLFIFKLHPVKALFCEFIPMFLIVISESLVLSIFNFIFNDTLNDVLSIPLLRIGSASLIFLLMYFTYRIIKYFKLNFIFLGSFAKKSKRLLFLTGFCGLLLLITQLYLIVFFINDVPILITIISTICLLSYLVISIYSIINISKLETTSQNLEREQLYNKSLAVLHDSVRGFKHDFANIVQAIGGYIDSNDMDGLRSYYTNLKRDCISINNLSALNPDTVNNPALYSLLCSKYHKAREYNIHMDLDIFIDFRELEPIVPTYDLSRLFGILLDNAIEASKDCEYKHIILKVHNTSDHQYASFLLQNTYSNKDVDTERIFHKGYSTKDGNSGLGLWEVHKYLSNHTQLDLYTQKDENYFSQELKIFYK